ncbi:MAG: PEGA domain-containing protein [Methanospirillum sp.]|uniref:PEGA domain-containing protein n=1 Tax=Methanospirillum sp. TaxID=45200 RepID=UPI00236EC7FC|nr:PEGA domain-containing protein [Methanospirillum sp.]MDD1728022.1 PEGA domain-containing protein [Methanospirillum sp.]
MSLRTYTVITLLLVAAFIGMVSAEPPVNGERYGFPQPTISLNDPQTSQGMGHGNNPDTRSPVSSPPQNSPDPSRHDQISNPGSGSRPNPYPVTGPGSGNTPPVIVPAPTPQKPVPMPSFKPQPINTPQPAYHPALPVNPPQPVNYPQPSYRREPVYRPVLPVSNPYPIYNDPPSRYRYVSSNHWDDDDYPYYYNSYPYYYRTGSLQVISTPYGSTVYLNDKYRGKTRYTGYLDITSIKPGTYDLLIQHDGYLPYTTSVYIGWGEVKTVNAILTPIEDTQSLEIGSLQIQSEPADAQVFLDHVFQGITPVTLSYLGPGEYTLTLQKNGYASYVSRVQVVGGQTLPITAILTSEQPATPVPTATPLPVQTAEPVPTRAGLPAGVILISLAAVVFGVSRRRT